MDTELAIVNRHQQQEELEQEAVNLVGFSDFILNNIKNSRDQGRWLSTDELIAFVEDFFAVNFPGTSIKPDERDGARVVALSEEAQRALGEFIDLRKPSTRTRLHRGRVTCLFDPRSADKLPQGIELIDPTHPLIIWIRDRYQHDSGQIYPLSALHISSKDVGLDPGQYVYCAQRWAFEGLKAETELAFCVMRIGADAPLTAEESEAVVYRAARLGAGLPNAQNQLGDLPTLHAAAALCEERLDERLGQRFEDFAAENEVRCQQQETSASKYANRRIAEYEGRVRRFQLGNRMNLVPMTQALIDKEREQLKDKIARIARRRSVNPTISLLATGVIRVE